MLMKMLVTMVMLMLPDGEYVDVFDKCGVGGGLKAACEGNNMILTVGYWNTNLGILMQVLLIIFYADDHLFHPQCWC